MPGIGPGGCWIMVGTDTIRGGGAEVVGGMGDVRDDLVYI